MGLICACEDAKLERDQIKRGKPFLLRQGLLTAALVKMRTFDHRETVAAFEPLDRNAALFLERTEPAA
jgi:hypothetical protein